MKTENVSEYIDPVDKQKTCSLTRNNTVALPFDTYVTDTMECFTVGLVDWALFYRRKNVLLYIKTLKQR